MPPTSVPRARPPTPGSRAEPVHGRVAVVGAGGYVGRRLAARLAAPDRHVVAVGRREETLPVGPGIERRAADASDAEAMAEALAGVDAAYYLVHAMAAGEGFAGRDRDLAECFGRAASAAGLSRIVYLGGLGTDDLSEHLRSRQEVGAVLADAPVPVVELRAAIVIGAGSISYEMLRYLTERLPVMVCPRWVDTLVQPIAERDLLEYLEQALTVPPGTYEIGGPEVTTYGEMMQRYASIRGLRRRRILKVPLLTPSLSAHWVDFATPVDRAVSHSLIESLTSDVVVRQPEATAAAFSVTPLPVAQAIEAALDEQAARMPETLLVLGEGLAEGVYAMRAHAGLTPELLGAARAELGTCGGDVTWYGASWLWRLRITGGRLFGEHLRLGRPAVVERGQCVDWWKVERKDDTTLVLGSTDWFCGDAWLGYHVAPASARIEQVGALRPKGLLGFVYWRALWPVHAVVFRLMARRRVARARLLAAATPDGA